MKAFACLSTLAGTISAVSSSPNRKIGKSVVATALGGQHLLEDLPSRRGVLGPVDRDQPARFVVEDFDEPPCVLVADAGDDTEALLLYRGSKLLHAATGCMLALIVLVDDGNWERLNRLH